MLFSRWCLDETVTHFIYKGRQNDNNKEYKSVKERGIHIVSEHWLLEVWSLLCSFIKSEGKWRLKSSCMAVYFLFAFVLNMYRNWCFASCFEFINWAISFQWCTLPCSPWGEKKFSSSEHFYYMFPRMRATCFSYVKYFFWWCFYCTFPMFRLCEISFISNQFLILC